MGFVFLCGQYLMKKLEVENFCSTSVAGGRTEKIEVHGGGGSVGPVVVCLQSGEIWWFGRGCTYVASVVAGDGAIADV
jgi:hypothetical protein